MPTPHGFHPDAIIRNIPPGSTDPVITPCGTIKHVAVSNATSLHDLFANDGGIESHFYIRTDGTFEQYRSIFHEADAQFDGNSFFLANRRVGFISLENQGGISPAGKPDGSGTWTDAQVATMKMLDRWVVAQSAIKIPFRKAPAWNAPGFGYHAMFEEWNLSHHSCPGAQRIQQFEDVFVPWYRAGAPAKRKRRKPKPASWRLAGWNCHVTNSAANVKAMLSELDQKYLVDKINLSEARTHFDVIEKWCRDNGFDHYQEKPVTGKTDGMVDETGDSALLVRKPNRVSNHRVAEMSEPWVVVQHNQEHTPRRYEIIVEPTGQTALRDRSSHWPTHGPTGVNAKAWNESALRSKQWFDKADKAVSVDVLDANATLAEVTSFFGSGYVVVGQSPDMCIAKNATVEHTTLDKGGSDHHAHLYVVTQA